MWPVWGWVLVLSGRTSCGRYTGRGLGRACSAPHSAHHPAHPVPSGPGDRGARACAPCRSLHCLQPPDCTPSRTECSRGYPACHVLFGVQTRPQVLKAVLILPGIPHLWVLAASSDSLDVVKAKPNQSRLQYVPFCPSSIPVWGVSWPPPPPVSGGSHYHRLSVHHFALLPPP